MRITQYKHLPPLLVQMHTSGSVGERTNYLDAEDHHFIEKVNASGKVNLAGATLAESYTPKRLGEDQSGSWRFAEARSREANRSRSVFFNDEMLAYWKNRWAFEDDCARERRLAYEEEHRARQRLREQYRLDKATAAGELEREELAWAKEQEKLALERQKRLLATMQADAEWEAAGGAGDPDEDGNTQKPAEWWRDVQAADRVRDAPFSENRHYVPIWKTEELEREYQEAHRQEEEEEQKRTEERKAREAEREEEARLKLEKLEQERQTAKREKTPEEWAIYHERVRLAKEELAEAERRRALDAKRRIEQYAEQQWFAYFGRYPPLRRKITD